MPKLDEFRRHCRDWLEENCPVSQRGPVQAHERYWGGRNADFCTPDAEKWFECMKEQCWIAPTWPSEYGGAGLSLEEGQVIKEEMRNIRARPPLYSLGLWMLGPALLQYGTKEQKAEHLPLISEGKIRWCQGYSEPGAGSDLASLQCKAEDAGDHFLLNGSKIWTTQADRCDWIFCLVRTGSFDKKQQGISFVLVDMDQPGVNVTPIRLISDESEFCQVFFDNARVPKENLVGDLHQGWSVAKSLLKHERQLMTDINENNPRANLPPLEALRMYADWTDDGEISDANLRLSVTEYQMRSQALDLTRRRSAEEIAAGHQSVLPLQLKYIATRLEVERSELMLQILGTRGLGWSGDEFSSEELNVTRSWTTSKTLTIAGGSSEIQLNIIADKVLGLPRSG